MPDLEAKVTPKIKEAIQAAIDKIGREEFLAMTEMPDQNLGEILSSDDQFVSVSALTLTCQINRSHDDPNRAHSSLNECLKGTIIRVPEIEKRSTTVEQSPPLRRQRYVGRSRGEGLNTRSSSGDIVKILSFSVSIFTFLVSGYFLGGLGVGPLLGLPTCVGVTTESPWLTPCAGSFVGLVVGAFCWLGYTYYYFTRRL